MEPSDNARAKEVQAETLDGLTTNETGGKHGEGSPVIVNTRTQVEGNDNTFASSALVDFEVAVKLLESKDLGVDFRIDGISFVDLGYSFATSVSPHAIPFPIESRSLEEIESLYQWAFFGDASYNEKTNQIALNLRHLVLVEICFNHGVFYLIEFQEEPEEYAGENTKRPPTLIFMAKNYAQMISGDIIKGLNEYARNRHVWGNGDTENKVFRRRINRNGEHKIVAYRAVQIQERLKKFLHDRVKL